MTVVASAAETVGSSPLDSVEFVYVTDDGARARVQLGQAWAVRFESALPARRFAWRKGQAHCSGRWWSATEGRHVGYESWLERDHLMLLDFDAEVVGIASQPFWLSWASSEGKAVSHVPDYFARRADGTALVLDCRPANRVEPKDAAKFEITRLVCDRVGWEFRLAGAPDAVMVANVRWLAGYRHPRHEVHSVAAALREVFALPAPLMVGAEAVGDPMAVLPVLFHLLWRRDLVAEMSVPLHDATMVTGCAA